MVSFLVVWMYHDQIAAPNVTTAMRPFTAPVMTVESTLVMPRYVKIMPMMVTIEVISPLSIMMNSEGQ